MEKVQWKISDIISKGWMLAKKEMIVLIGLLLLYQVVLMVLNMFSISTELINAALSGNPQMILYTSYTGSQWFFQLLTFVLGCWFAVGMTQLTLDIAKGNEVNFESFVKTLRKVPAYFGATVLCFIPLVIYFSLLVALPIALLLNQSTFIWILYTILSLLSIPLLWLYIRLSLYPYFIVDKDYGPWKALTESFRLTKGSSCKMFGLILLIACFFILGILALIVGVFVAYALVMMMIPVLYLTLTGYQPEEMAEPAPAPVEKKIIKEEDYMPTGSNASSEKTHQEDNKDDESRFMPQ